MIAIMLMAFERSLISARARDVRQIECGMCNHVDRVNIFWLLILLKLETAWMNELMGGEGNKCGKAFIATAAASAIYRW